MVNRRRLSLKRSREGFQHQHWRWVFSSNYPKRQWVHQSVPLFRKAFKRWLKAHRQKLGVRLEITGRLPDGLSLRLVDYPDCLVVAAYRHQMSVSVCYDGCFDFLLCKVSFPVREGGQVFCESLRPESRTLYRSLEAYWEGHEFDRFGDWLIRKLVPAKWLGIYRNWAELTMDEPKGDELIKAIQLR